MSHLVSRLLSSKVRGSAFALLALATSGCRGCDAPTGERPDAPRAAASAGAVARGDAGAAGTGDATAANALREDGRTYATQSFAFRVASTDVWLEDVAMGKDLETPLERAGAGLAINGGFFDTDTRPLGLALSRGKVLSPFSKTMSGGVLTLDAERATLTPTESFEPATAAADARFAVQCRPRLVVDGKVNIKRDDGKRSARTALCVKDQGRTLVAVLVRDGSDPSYGPSLYALATWLSADGCESALNLDGGPSTGVAWRDGGGVHVAGPTAGVRHAVLFKER